MKYTRAIGQIKPHKKGEKKTKAGSGSRYSTHMDEFHKIKHQTSELKIQTITLWLFKHMQTHFLSA